MLLIYVIYINKKKMGQKCKKKITIYGNRVPENR
jgi:hypothetical protein